MSYKFLEHTADVCFEAEGKTLEDLFINCALALKESITEEKIKEKKEEKIFIKERDLESLLYSFLEELLVLIDIKKFIFSSIKEIKIEGFSLKAVVLGDDVRNYKISNPVKAITYNSMKIEKTKKNFKTKVVLDV